MTHTLEIAALMTGARYCAQCQDSGYKQVHWHLMGRVFPEPCACAAGKEVRAMKQVVSKVWENADRDWPR